MEKAIETGRATVLAVDDTPSNLTLVAELLRDEYRVRLAPSGPKALDLIEKSVPDLILLDVNMPDMDGYEVIGRLKASEATRNVPVVFLTAQTSIEAEQRGLDLGAVDYVHKPISPPVLLARVKTHLVVKEHADFLQDQAAYLEAEVARRTDELTAAQDVTILALASMAETRDNETGNHVRRTQHYMRALVEYLGDHERFRDALDGRAEPLFKSAALHDIGKIGIPDRILLKPGRLTPEEFDIMKTHTTLGYEALERAEKQLQRPVPFLDLAKEIALTHQEKWDGSGYPRGLAGDDIPVSGRLMAVADVYDALISWRPYKDPMSHEKASSIILEGRGSHFDPDVADAFAALEGEFASIANRLTDTPEEKDAVLRQARLAGATDEDA